MKCVIDDKIPYLQGVFEPFGEVVYLPGNKISAADVQDADALFIRTRTCCDEKLLAGSSVRFIATATIGYDHIDTVFCENAGIRWVNAPGSNSKSVEQYIASALIILSKRKGFLLKDKTIGIIGVGQVGSKVAKVCKLFGMNVLLNDPPRSRTEGWDGFSTLDELLEKSDILTLHIPLNLEGHDATYHLSNPAFFSALKRKPILINSCRGEVLDTPATKVACLSGQISGLVLDCWENEPDIDLELLAMSDLATPHIAGYSRDGKAMATTMTVQAASRFFGLGLDAWQVDQIEEPETNTIYLNGLNLSEDEILAKAILATYDIQKDDAVFRRNPDRFEDLRGNYPVRREFGAYRIKPSNINGQTLELLKNLGLRVL